MIEENGGGNQIGGTATTNPTISEVDRFVQRSVYESDRRHRVTISGVYHLPFGREQKFMNSSSPLVDGLLGGWEVAGMWLFNSGRPWGLPQNVFYVKDATIENVDFSQDIIRGVQPCVGTMNNSGQVTLQGYSVAAGCTEAFFIIKPNFTGAGAEFRDDQIRRPPFYQFDVNFAKSTRLAGNVRLQVRFEVYNLFNQTVYDERNYESNPTNAAVRHDRSPGRASVELPALRTDRHQAAVLSRRRVIFFHHRPGRMRMRPGLAVSASPFPSLPRSRFTIHAARVARDVTWADLPVGVQQALASRKIDAARFPSWVKEIRAANETRLRDGNYDHLIHYALQSTRVTALPPIEPALSAKAFVESTSKQIPSDAHARLIAFAAVLSKASGEGETETREWRIFATSLAACAARRWKRA